jgi:hypothetical protein
LAIDDDVVAAVVETAIVVVVARGNTVLLEMGTETELSTLIATTSDGDEPHDTLINIENAMVGPIMCLSREVISRD